MDWLGLERHLLSKHPGDPNRSERVHYALSRAKEALALLEPLGYQFHLADGPGPVWPTWPAMMFHVDAAPNGRLVADEQELEELGPGWFRTQMEAQLWDGVQTQNAGRGGIPRQSIPALGPPPTLAEVAEFMRCAEQAKTDMIAAFKAGQLDMVTQTIEPGLGPLAKYAERRSA